jgi:tetratricopeptide (TPR) repeat protein
MLKVEDLQDLIARKKGAPDESLATLYSSLGKAYEQKLHSGQSTNYRDDLQSAIAAYQKAVELQEELKSDLALATSLNNLAELYRNQGRYTEAEPLYLRSLAIWEKQLGADHPLVAASLNNLGLLYYTQGRYVEADPLYWRSLSIMEKQSRADHPDFASSLNNLALFYNAQGRYAEAEPLYQRALQICEQNLGIAHPNTMAVRGNYARCLKEWVASRQQTFPIQIQKQI